MPSLIEIPLLKDHHSHPLFYSAFGQGVSLESITTKEAATIGLRSAFDLATSELTVAHGWRSNFFEWSAAELESMPPVAIFNVSLHSLLINQAGQEILRQRYGDAIDNLEDRTWYEANLRVVLNWFANLYASIENLRAFYDLLLRQGVYFAEEMLLVDEQEIRLFEQAGLLDRTRFWAAPDSFELLSRSAKDQVSGLKLFTDGAIGSRTAAMRRPYIGGDEADLGMLIYRDEELVTAIDRCFETGKSLAIHAIGDRAIEQVVRSLEQCSAAAETVPEVRIEHAQMISPELAGRAKDLGVILCMQPNFSSDSVDYSDRMDVGYCEMNNPFRMLIDEIGFVPGEDLIFGSDGMPHGVEAAASQSFFPPLENQRLTVDEFVAGYCLDDTRHGVIQLEIDDDLRTVNHSVV